MKKVIAVLGGALICLSVFAAEGPDPGVPLIIASASTNAAPITADQATSATAVTRWLDGFFIDITGTHSTPTCTVAVVTLGGTGGGASRTLLSAKVITADTILFPSELRDTTAGADITGAATRIPLLNDKITVKAYAKYATNALQVVFYPIYSFQP